MTYSFGNTLWLLITENFIKVQNLGHFRAAHFKAYNGLYYLDFTVIPGYCPILIPLLVRNKVTCDYVQSDSQ